MSKDILESLGYEVLLAVDGLESMEVFREKNTEIENNCKVIISSGYTQDKNIDELIKHE